MLKFNVVGVGTRILTIKRKFRHILNHSQMIRADQIPKIKKYGLSCSIQPQFVESDAPWVGFIIILAGFWVGWSLDDFGLAF